MRRRFLQHASLERSVRHSRGVAALGLCAAIMCGCHRNHTTATAVSKPPTASPVVQGEASGLEVWSWLVVDPRVLPAPFAHADGEAPAEPRVRVIDNRPSLETLLSHDLERPVPMSDEARERWKACGFRIVAVPAADLEPMQDHMRVSGQVQRQWLGEVNRWTDIARGPETTEPRPVRLDTGDLVLDPGRTSLMVRCWSTPISSEGGHPVPALRLQLVPEFTPDVDPVKKWSAAAGLSASTQGQTFARLMLDLVLTKPGEAYLITADAPGVDWARPDAPAQETSEGGAGPVPPRAPTLGEFMLSAPAAMGQPRVRAVIVLVPRIPTRFDLLP